MHFNRYISFWSHRLVDTPILVCEDEQISWREFDNSTAMIAAFLTEQGIGHNDRFGCLLDNSIPWCVSFGASIRLGTIFVPFNALFGPFELKQISDDADCSVILSSPEHIGKIDETLIDSEDTSELRIYFPISRQPSVAYADVVAMGLPWEDRRFEDSDVLAICYTSGTTGVPKGAMLTHRNVETASNGIFSNCGMCAGDERFLILAPLGFTGGIISNLAPLFMIGGSGYLEKRVDPVRALSMIIKHRITSLGGVPALWERISIASGFAEADISSLRMAVTGGAPVPRELLETFLAKGVAIRQQYGFTEACGGVASYDAKGAAANPAACGFAMPSMDLEIRDDTGMKVAPGQIGEICARGGQLMKGYWRKPEMTAKAIVDGWYQTGDLATYAEDGAIIVVDRKKNMLISGGVNIYPAEVERAMYQIDGVVEVAVLGIDSGKWGQEVAAIVHAPEHNDSAAIFVAARDFLGAYKAPKHIALSIEPLPKTASGKIARTGLVELFRQIAPAAVGEAALS